MPRRLAISVVLALTVACSSASRDTQSESSTTARPTPTSLVAPNSSTTPAVITTGTPIRFDGLGPVRVGMTYEEAAQAASTTPRITDALDTNGECVDVTFDDPAGFSFMGSKGRLVRLNVEGKSYKTEAGVGIGSTEDDVRAAYGNAVTATVHPYVPTGHYLTVEPADPTVEGVRMIFETDGSRVTSYRTGLPPFVDYIEGCA